MTEDEIRAATNEDLIARFAELGVEQYQCDDDEAWCVDVIKDDNPALIHYTRLYREMEAISKELKARGPDARRQLIPLYDHPNVQVRLQAARFSYGVAREAARKCIEKIRTSPLAYYRLEAGMTIGFLDDGTSKLD
jgi:hypothetical protein